MPRVRGLRTSTSQAREEDDDDDVASAGATGGDGGSANHAARARGACARTARATRIARDANGFLRAGGEGNNITSALVEQMRGKIAEGLEADAVDVRDESGNARHVSIKVVSRAFEGKSSVNRQRMVYKCIWMELRDQVHAVNEMVTLTPEEASK